MPVRHPCRHVARRTGAALAAAAALVTASLVTAGPAAATSGGLHWGACPDPKADKGLQCATVTVPVDYDHPHGATMTVEISRLPAADPAHRRGVLLLNPGGPGSSGLDMPNTRVDLGWPASVLARYDLIGFDPRGVGHSSPITCHLDGTQVTRAQILPTYAAKPSDVDRYAKIAERIVRQCQRFDNGTLRHITTENTARDMDRIRVALGEPRISYYGGSYGTYLGAVYSQLFPHRTDRFVLDSADGRVGYADYRTWGPSVELRFPDFAKWAAQRDPTYHLGRTPAAVRQDYLTLAHRLDLHPQGLFDGTFFRLTVRSGLYQDAEFPQLAQTWQRLRTGAPAAAPSLATTARSSAPTVPAIQSGYAVEMAVSCNDTAWPRSLATYKKAVAHDRKRYPLYGAQAANVYPCAFWPKPLDPTVRLTGHGPANILVLQNRRDPATIYSGGVLLRHQLGQRARLVSVDAGGHGVYLRVGNACVDNLTTRFLVDGAFPASDRNCRAEP